MSSFVDSCKSSTYDEQTHTLWARLQKSDGSYQFSCLELNKHIGNCKGYLEGGGQGFLNSAKDINYREHPPTLLATLRDADGAWFPQQALSLGDYIANEDGVLSWDGDLGGGFPDSGDQDGVGDDVKKFLSPETVSWIEWARKK